MIIDDYHNILNKYKLKYGENTILLYQNGSFFELYGVNNEKEKYGCENIKEISDLLNIQMTRKNKAILENDMHNPLMAGFPSHSLKKFVQILINNNNTVVLVEQITPPPNPERGVTEIYSPGTYLDSIDQINDTNNIVCVYIECNKEIKTNKKVLSIGLSNIDITTGKNTVYDVLLSSLNDDDTNFSLDETFRFIQIFNPKEVLLCFNKDSELNLDNELLDTNIDDFYIKYLELENRYTHKIKEINKNIFKLKYQQDFFHKIFPSHGLISSIEYLNLENKPIAIISYILLLNYCYEHNQNIINMIDIPQIWENTGHLILENNSMEQLNVINYKNKYNKNNSLFGIVNNTSTNIGKRYLFNSLLNPITDENILNKRYDFIDFMLLNKNYTIIESYLQKIIDIERIHRRMSLKMINPCDFISLDLAYTNIKEIINYIIKNDNGKIDLTIIKVDNKVLKELDEYIKDYKKYLNFDEIYKYNINNISNSFFNKGIFKEIDDLKDEIDFYLDFLNKLCIKLSKVIDDNETNIKLEYNERDGYYLQSTIKRATTMQNIIGKKKTFTIEMDIPQKYSFKNYLKMKEKDGMVEIDLKSIQFKNSQSTVCKLNVEIVKIISEKLNVLKERIKEASYNKFIDLLVDLYNKNNKLFNTISHIISCVDFFKSAAKSSIIYGYKRPIIDLSNDNNKKSYIEAKDMRHPIIERIQCDIPYITNDIIIGKDNIDGILLYGVNASGKSSFMKSIGLNIILAQTGLFVACNYFKYKPYKYIFTRILNNDNIFKGQSSFAVEMSELRSILKRSNKDSIVLGDELCSGTENISGVSIVAAGIIKLCEKKSSFIFATHLHQLSTMERIKSISNLKIYHVKVKYDNELKMLIYNRKLDEGSGDSIYGLEVCKAMQLDKEFLELANNIRNEITDDKEIFNSKNSSYNSNIYYDMCNICNIKKSDHIHHIKYQEEADKNNMIEHFHKNSKFNLTALCEECHHKVHNNSIIIYGYIMTSEGIKLKYDNINIINNTININNNNIINNNNTININNNTKYDKEIIDYVLGLKESVKKYAEASRIIKNNKNINMTTKYIKKIWEGV